MIPRQKGSCERNLRAYEYSLFLSLNNCVSLQRIRVPKNHYTRKRFMILNEHYVETQLKLPENDL